MSAPDAAPQDSAATSAPDDIPRLEALGLGKRYRKRWVVDEVSMEVRGGEVVGLLGPNGAGKTTAFYMMVGLVEPDAGRVVLNGRDIAGLPLHARAALGLGYLPQESSVFRRLSVADNIRVALEARRDLAGAAVEETLERLLDELQIARLRDHQGESLSGGERRRVEIARALAAAPSFLLLDEPFAGIDPLAVAEIRKLVQRLCAQGIGLLITDHNVRETLGVCDRAYILSEGKMLASGEPRALLINDLVRDHYLGRSFKIEDAP